MRLSIIITTFNWPEALLLVLKSVIPQLPAKSEIIIADDGSNIENQRLIKNFIATQQQLPIHYVWQENKGFRAAKIRNKAIMKASGNYCIFLDGDSIPKQGFISNHLKLQQIKCMVAGNRVLLSKNFSRDLLNNPYDISKLKLISWILLRIKKSINRLSPLLFLPGNKWRIKKGLAWRNIKTCNLGVWRSDLIEVNGFDEEFTGWGYEDSELAIRLLRIGCLHTSAKFAAPILHLWHPENSRINHDKNKKLLEQRIDVALAKPKLGLDQYSHTT